MPAPSPALLTPTPTALLTPTPTALEVTGIALDLEAQRLFTTSLDETARIHALPPEGNPATAADICPDREEDPEVPAGGGMEVPVASSSEAGGGARSWVRGTPQHRSYAALEALSRARAREERAVFRDRRATTVLHCQPQPHRTVTHCQPQPQPQPHGRLSSSRRTVARDRLTRELDWPTDPPPRPWGRPPRGGARGRERAWGRLRPAGPTQPAPQPSPLPPPQELPISSERRRGVGLRLLWGLPGRQSRLDRSTTRLLGFVLVSGCGGRGGRGWSGFPLKPGSLTSRAGVPLTPSAQARRRLDSRSAMVGTPRRQSRRWPPYTGSRPTRPARSPPLPPSERQQESMAGLGDWE